MEKCICGHTKEQHQPNITDTHVSTDFCIFCYPVTNNAQACWHDFKLDNLQYIEDMAKEKNLI